MISPYIKYKRILVIQCESRLVRVILRVIVSHVSKKGLCVLPTEDWMETELRLLSFTTVSAYELSAWTEIDLLLQMDTAITFWTGCVTNKPYALDPDLVAHIRAY
jgi:hypothetical protein